MNHSADIAFDMLREGNARFVRGDDRRHFTAEERAALTAGQAPWAVVVGCSDSRVPIEVIFDVGAGELFVVRTAGHVLSEAGLASVRFAVEKLGTELVVVLGHEDCGAVNAAWSGSSPAWLAPITDHIRVDAETLPEAVEQHVRESVTEMRDWFRTAGLARPPRLVGAAYQLASGEVHWLES